MKKNSKDYLKIIKASERVLKNLNKNHLDFIKSNSNEKPPKYKKYRAFAFNDCTGEIMHTSYRKTEQATFENISALYLQNFTIYITHNNKIYNIFKINTIF